MRVYDKQLVWVFANVYTLRQCLIGSSEGKVAGTIPGLIYGSIKCNSDWPGFESASQQSRDLWAPGTKCLCVLYQR